MTRRLLKTNEERFWNWFSQNADKYLHLEDDRDHLFQALKIELEKINSNLTFEFSNLFEDGSREFVISADGIKSLFPTVMTLVNHAPVLKNWRIIAFRQPHKDISQVTYQGLTVKLNDVFFYYTKDSGKIDLELHIRGFFESPEWTGISFILLDTVLGEFNAEMYISGIKKKLLIEAEVDDLVTLKDLPKIVLEYQLELNN